MGKFTKELLTGVVALGMMAPVATTAINPIQTTVNAKRRYHHKRRAKKVYRIKLYNVKLSVIPKWLRGTWFNRSASYRNHIAYTMSFDHYMDGYNQRNGSDGNGAFYKVYRHGHVTNQFIEIPNTIGMTKHGRYYLVKSPSNEVIHVFHEGKHIFMRSNTKRTNKYYYTDNGRFFKLTRRQVRELP